MKPTRPTTAVVHDHGGKTPRDFVIAALTPETTNPFRLMKSLPLHSVILSFLCTLLAMQRVTLADPLPEGTEVAGSLDVYGTAAGQVLELGFDRLPVFGDGSTGLTLSVVPWGNPASTDWGVHSIFAAGASQAWWTWQLADGSEILSLHGAAGTGEMKVARLEATERVTTPQLSIVNTVQGVETGLEITPFHIPWVMAGTVLNASDPGGYVRALVFQTNGGNVGIGIITPQARLHVQGNALINGSLSASGPGIFQGNAGDEGGTTLALKTTGDAQGLLAGVSFYPTFQNTAPDHGARRAADLVAGFQGGAWGHEFLAFRVGRQVGSDNSNDVQELTREHLRILANGHVGIGTTTPEEKLQVAGNLKVDGVIRTTAPAGDIPMFDPAH